MHAQTVLLGDLLRAEVLLDRERVIGAALDGRVVRNDHALASFNRRDARHDAGRGCRVGIDAVRGERRKFEKRRERIAQPVDALASRKLPPAAMAFHRRRASAVAHFAKPFAQAADRFAHRRFVLVKVFAAGREPGLNGTHTRAFRRRAGRPAL